MLSSNKNVNFLEIIVKITFILKLFNSYSSQNTNVAGK